MADRSDNGLTVISLRKDVGDELDSLRKDVSTQNGELREQMKHLLGELKRLEEAKDEDEEEKEDEDEDEDEDEEKLLPGDTYSIFATSDYVKYAEIRGRCIPRPRRIFLVAFGVFVLQVLTLSLLVIDIIDPGNGNNPMQIPPGVDFTVRVSQFIAIVITVISQDETTQSLNVLYHTTADGANVRYRVKEKGKGKGASLLTPSWKWFLSAIVRVMVGWLEIAVTFMLIMGSETVRDLLLNFTAVEFISNVDNFIFTFCGWGYFGIEVANEIKRIKKIRKTSASESAGGTGFWAWMACTVRAWSRLGCMSTTLVILFGFWVWLSIEQGKGAFRPQHIYVQFGDEFSAALGTFAGLYEYEQSRAWDWGFTGGKRGSYVLKQAGTFDGSARFVYCLKERAWVFQAKTKGSEPFPSDECDSIRALSSESVSYDITDTAGGTWYIRDGSTNRDLPLLHLSMEAPDVVRGSPCEKDSDCGQADTPRFQCKDRQCLCTDGIFGSLCQFATLCEILEFDQKLTGFSLTYNITDLRAFNRKVYLSEDEEDAIFFVGRRWALAKVDRSRVEELFESFHPFWNREDVSFLSDPIDFNSPNEQLSPIGVRWYEAEDKFRIRPGEAQGVVSNRVVDASLFCAKCDNSTNPCFEGHTCNAERNCDCGVGFEGSLCQLRLDGDGQCHAGPNIRKYQYDGGDCCRQTCRDTSELEPSKRCGFVDGVFQGYPDCRDPDFGCPISSHVCWKTQGKVGSNPGSSRFVSSVALAKNGSVVAALDATRGEVFVLEDDGKEWQQRGNSSVSCQTAVLTNDTLPSSALAISGDGNVVAVGCPHDLETRGIVRVFRFASDQNDWRQDDDIVGVGTDGDRFGWSVSLSDDGSVLAIGAPSLQSAGYASILQYNANSSTWDRVGGFLELRSSQGRVGRSVALSGDGATVAIGIPGVDSGQVRGYHSGQHNGLWRLIGDPIIGGGLTGSSISMSRDGATLAVVEDGVEGTSPFVAVYRNEDSWVAVGEAVRGVATDQVSLSLSANGSTVAIRDTVRKFSAVYELGELETWSQLGTDILDSSQAEGQGVEVQSVQGGGVALDEIGAVLATGRAIPNAFDDFIQVRWKTSGTAERPEEEEFYGQVSPLDPRIEGTDQSPTEIFLSLRTGREASWSHTLDVLCSPNETMPTDRFMQMASSDYTALHSWFKVEPMSSCSATLNHTSEETDYTLSINGRTARGTSLLFEREGQAISGALERVQFTADSSPSLLRLLLSITTGGTLPSLTLQCNNTFELRLIPTEEIRTEASVAYMLPEGTLCRVRKATIDGVYEVEVEGVVVAGGAGGGRRAESEFLVSRTEDAVIAITVDVNATSSNNAFPVPEFSLTCGDDGPINDFISDRPEVYYVTMNSICRVSASDGISYRLEIQGDMYKEGDGPDDFQLIALPNETLAPTVSLSPSTLPTPAPTPRSVTYFFQQGLGCPGDEIPLPSYGAGCDLDKMIFEYRVEASNSLPVGALCALGRPAAGGGRGGCRLCGDGEADTRTPVLRTDRNQGANSCVQVDVLADWYAALKPAIGGGDEFCNSNFLDADGGSFVTGTLPTRMAEVLVGAFCVRPPSMQPTPSPTPRLVSYFKQQGVICSGDEVPMSGYGTGCDLERVQFEYTVGKKPVLPANALCASGRPAAGGGIGGCRLCGDGMTVTRVPQLLTNRRAEGATSCVQVRILRDWYAALAEEIDEAELCGNDFLDNDGGSYVTSTLPERMPAVLAGTFCRKKLE